MDSKSLIEQLRSEIRHTLKSEIRSIIKGNRPLPRRLLTEQEAADLLGVSVKTLPVWRHKGKGPDYVKIESSIRYKLADINAYIKKKTVTLESKPSTIKKGGTSHEKPSPNQSKEAPIKEENRKPEVASKAYYYPAKN